MESTFTAFPPDALRALIRLWVRLVSFHCFTAEMKKIFHKELHKCVSQLAGKMHCTELQFGGQKSADVGQMGSFT